MEMNGKFQISAKNGIVWLLQKGTVSAYLILICELRTNSKNHGSRRGEIWSMLSQLSFLRAVVRVVQFKIHWCFRTGARQRSPRTLVPKLALVKTVQTPGQEYRIKKKLCKLRIPFVSEPKFINGISTHQYWS